MSKAKVVDPFGEDPPAELPSVHGDSEVIDASPPVPLEVKIALLRQEAEEGNEAAAKELEALLAENGRGDASADLSAEELAQQAQEDRTPSREAKRDARKPGRRPRVVSETPSGIPAETPRADEFMGLSDSQKLDIVIRWMHENAPKLDAVLAAYSNFERERQADRAMYHYQCLECGQITEAPRPEARTSADQAVKCPNCFPKKGLTPHDIVEYREAV